MMWWGLQVATGGEIGRGWSKTHSSCSSVSISCTNPCNKPGMLNRFLKLGTSQSSRCSVHCLNVTSPRSHTVCVDWMNGWTNESNNIRGKMSFYIPLFVCVCVRVCVLALRVVWWCLLWVPLCLCIYLHWVLFCQFNTEQHCLLFLFCMEQSRCTKKYVVFFLKKKKGVTSLRKTALVDSNAGPSLSL